MNPQQTECRRCGTCCVKGGPALHHEDLPLFSNKTVSIDNVFTIRKGEPAHSPLENAIIPSTKEIIKIAGINNSWQCLFFNTKINGCGIYQNRPVECSTLKCWAPEELAELIFKNTLSRKDILQENPTVLELIEMQESNCSFEKLDTLCSQLDHNKQESEVLHEIKNIVEWDLRFRHTYCNKLQIGLSKELAYFGRPLYQSLTYFNLSITESPAGISIKRLPEAQ